MPKNLHRGLLIVGMSLCSFCFLFAQKKLYFPLQINKREGRLVALPMVFYEPRLSWGFGVLGSMAFYTNALSQKMSTLQMYATYTLRNQLIIKFKNFIHFGKHDQHLLKGEIYFNDFEEDTYGYGGMTSEFLKQILAYKSLGISQQYLRRWNTTPLYLGVCYEYHRYWDFQNRTDENNNQLYGISFAKTITRSMIGLGGIFDSRDKINAPTQGWFLELFLKSDIPALGATQSSNFEIFADLRHYISLSIEKRQVLAFRFFSHYAFGDIPYIALPRVGESHTSRGLKEGRYRNNFFTTLEAEFRFALFPHHKHSIFYGLQATVFSGWNWINNQTFFDQSLLPTFGVGLRYYFDVLSGISGRGDVALGLQDNKGLYVNMNEVF